MSDQPRSNRPHPQAPPETSRIAGIILCGGKSSRMGRPKLSLPFGGTTMLARMVQLHKQVVSPVVVVAAPSQVLPKLSDDVIIAHDESEYHGPLAGILTGMQALDGRADAAYVAPCDTPLLTPNFMKRMISRLGTHDLAIPRDGKYHHPLAAVYRVSLINRIQSLISADRMRPLFLVEQSDSVIVDVSELKDIDPDLNSLANINTPEDYHKLLKLAGLVESRTDEK